MTNNESKMLIKGRICGDGALLAQYLTSDKHANSELIELRGSRFPDLRGALETWEANAKGTGCTKPLWHAVMRPSDGNAMTRSEKLQAVDELERQLGLNNQPRAVLAANRSCLHIVWSRIDRATGKVYQPRA